MRTLWPRIWLFARQHCRLLVQCRALSPPDAAASGDASATVFAQTAYASSRRSSGYLVPQPGREQPEHFAGRNQTDQPQDAQNAEPPNDRGRKTTGTA